MITGNDFTKLTDFSLERTFVGVSLSHFSLLTRYTMWVLGQMSEKMPEASRLCFEVPPGFGFFSQKVPFLLLRPHHDPTVLRLRRVVVFPMIPDPPPMHPDRNLEA